jgi:hypothetical protein
MWLKSPTIQGQIEELIASYNGPRGGEKAWVLGEFLLYHPEMRWTDAELYYKEIKDANKTRVPL